MNEQAPVDSIVFFDSLYRRLIKEPLKNKRCTTPDIYFLTADDLCCKSKFYGGWLNNPLSVAIAGRLYVIHFSLVNEPDLLSFFKRHPELEQNGALMRLSNPLDNVISDETEVVPCVLEGVFHELFEVRLNETWYPVVFWPPSLNKNSTHVLLEYDPDKPFHPDLYMERSLFECFGSVVEYNPKTLPSQGNIRCRRWKLCENEWIYLMLNKRYQSLIGLEL